MNREQYEDLLAAYLVGELDAQTRADLESALESDAELRDRLGDLRLTLKLVRQGLQEEGQPRLSDSRRDALLGEVARGVPAAEAKKPVARKKVILWRRPLPMSLTALAAMLVLALGLVAVMMPSLGTHHEMARGGAPSHAAPAEPAGAESARESRPGERDGESVVAYHRDSYVESRSELEQKQADKRLGEKEPVALARNTDEKYRYDNQIDDLSATRNGAGQGWFGGQPTRDQYEQAGRRTGQNDIADHQDAGVQGDALLSESWKKSDDRARGRTEGDFKQYVSFSLGGEKARTGLEDGATYYAKGKSGLDRSPEIAGVGGTTIRSSDGESRGGDRTFTATGGGRTAGDGKREWRSGHPDYGLNTIPRGPQGGVAEKDLSGTPQPATGNNFTGGTTVIAGDSVHVDGGYSQLMPGPSPIHGLTPSADSPAAPPARRPPPPLPVVSGKAAGTGEGGSLRLTNNLSPDQAKELAKSGAGKLDETETLSKGARGGAARDLDGDGDRDLADGKKKKLEEADRLRGEADRPRFAREPQPSPAPAAAPKPAEGRDVALDSTVKSAPHAEESTPADAHKENLPADALRELEKLRKEGKDQPLLAKISPEPSRPEVGLKAIKDLDLSAVDEAGKQTPPAGGPAPADVGKPSSGTGEARKHETGMPAAASTAPAGRTSSPGGATDEDGRESAEGRKGLPPASTFREVPVNPWVMTERDRYSTFALDVDTASYTMCRAYLRSGYLPPRGAVRMEEFINAFDYNYPRLARGVFNIFAQAAPSPFAAAGEDVTLLKIGVQGRVIGREGRKTAHLVFVVDVSGSMATSDRLPLVQKSLRMLVGALAPEDRVSLVTYGREASLLLESVPASKKDDILAAVEKMRAGGSTNLLAGLEAGYNLARREFAAGRINRVVLCSDGAANVGQTDAEVILEHVAGYRKHGITLTVAGFGRGGYNDELMETLAKKGDGSYLFIDTPEQARQAFVENMTAALQTIALDAKIQVEFDPTKVRRYRLIGYEKRQIADQDFRNDTIVAAQVGSGQSATALYELELTGKDRDLPSGTLGTVFVRYADPDGRKVEEISHPIEARIVKPAQVASDPRFFLAACAARFAEILRESPHARDATLGQVEGVLQQVTKALPLDNRASELLSLVQRAKGLPRAP